MTCLFAQWRSFLILVTIICACLRKKNPLKCTLIGQLQDFLAALLHHHDLEHFMTMFNSQQWEEKEAKSWKYFFFFFFSTKKKLDEHNSDFVQITGGEKWRAFVRLFLCGGLAASPSSGGGWWTEPRDRVVAACELLKRAEPMTGASGDVTSN